MTMITMYHLAAFLLYSLHSLIPILFFSSSLLENYVTRFEDEFEEKNYCNNKYYTTRCDILSFTLMFKSYRFHT